MSALILAMRPANAHTFFSASFGMDMICSGALDLMMLVEAQKLQLPRRYVRAYAALAAQHDMWAGSVK